MIDEIFRKIWDWRNDKISEADLEEVIQEYARAEVLKELKEIFGEDNTSDEIAENVKFLIKALEERTDEKDNC